MKKSLTVFLLFLAQIYLILKGVAHFDKLVNPFYLLGTSLIIIFYYCQVVFFKTNSQIDTPPANGFGKITGLAIGAISMLLLYPQLNAIFLQCPDPSTGSDVIPQIDALYVRFSKGIFPYYPLEQFGWHPYPVYMPLHWLPLFFAYATHTDIRWIGVVFLTIATAIWGYCVSLKRFSLMQLIAILLPSLAFYVYISFQGWELGITYEFIIAAYYLILAVGLYSRNILLTTIGVICCLLSRYTVIFWLPFFLFCYWQNANLKKNILFWAAITASIFLIYLVPFYFKDPSILSKGIAYHNNCYVIQWQGNENTGETGAFNDGLNFSYFIRAAFKGSMERRVFYARIIQASLMMLLNVVGIFFYRKWRSRINYYDLSLAVLYLVLLFFFIFSPFTYRYYYLDFFVLSAVVCGKVLLRPRNSIAP